MLYARLASLSQGRAARPLVGGRARMASLHRFLTSGSRDKRNDDVVVPGMRAGHGYGSLGGELPLPGRHQDATPWQASHNIDVQRVTQKAIV